MTEKRRKKVSYILAFAIPIAFLLSFMAVKQCYPFGDNTLMLSDLHGQYLGYFCELIDKLSNGESIFYSWNAGLGENFYADFGYYLGSPFVWIAILFGKSHIELGIIVIWALQLGFIGLATCYFFENSIVNVMESGKLRLACTVLFSVAFSFCDFLLAYRFNILWLVTFILIPFVLLGVERLVFKNDARLYVISLILCFITNFYFSWFACIFALIWYIDLQKGSFVQGAKSFVKFILASIFAALTGAAVLIPCYIQALSRDGQTDFAAEYSLTSFGNIGEFIQNFFFGAAISSTGKSEYANNNYCGIFVLLLATLYIFQPDKPIARRIKRVAILVILAASLNWIGTLYVMQGFSIPHGCNQRYMFILVYMLLITAFEALASISRSRIRHAIVAFAVFIIAIEIVFNTTSDAQDIWVYLVTFAIWTYLLICVVLYKRGSIKRTSLVINVLIIGFVELFTNAFIVTNDSYESTDVSRLADVTSWAEVYDSIDTENGARKTSKINDQDTFWYSDADTFSSCANANVLSLYKSLGLAYYDNGAVYTYKGTTPLTAALLNVDYVLTNVEANYGGYAAETSYTLSDGSEYALYTTGYDAELAFVLPSSVLEWDLDSSNAIANQNAFTSEVLGVGDIFTEVVISDIEYAGECAFVTSAVDGAYTYTNINMSNSDRVGVCLTFEIEADDHLYVMLSDEYYTCAAIAIDGETYVVNSNYYPTSIIDLGKLSAGQEVCIYSFNKTSITETSVLNVAFYSYNDEVMQQCLELMNESPMVITEFADTYVSGVVNVVNSGDVLYTSIPYYKGWTVYVDGVATEVELIGDALIGVKLEAGEHVVEFKYFPYGLKLGILLSILGSLGVVYIFAKGRVHEQIQS